MIIIKTPEEIELMRIAGKKLARILRLLKEECKAGVETKYLDQKARELCEKENVTPAFLGYTPYGAKRPFPAAVCITLDDEIIHGIPNENSKILKNTDLIVLDMGIAYKGMIVDAAISFFVGGEKFGDERGLKLIAADQAGIDAGISVCKPGVRTGDIGEAVEKAIKKASKPYKFAIFDQLGGHGVGRFVHEEPFIPSVGKKGEGPILKEGMTIAIEPILGEGKSEMYLARDGYTYKTVDKKRSVQIEHTILITADGAEILTQE